MKIAFVGKGGSGKSVVSSLFITYLLNKYPEKNIYAVDADLNIHLPRYLGLDVQKTNLLHLSNPSSMRDIKTYLMHKNKRIEDIDHFRKTTPPARGSKIINLDDRNNYIYKNYAISKGNLFLSIVGTYSEDKIGQSCYHDHLSIFENILSHSIDKNSYLIADMVAGIDAFSGSLYAQFDTLIIVVEPSSASINVFNQYLNLAKKGGIDDLIKVVGNKAVSADDIEYISQYIPRKYLLGTLGYSEHVRNVDRGIEKLSLGDLGKDNLSVLEKIDFHIKNITFDPNKRLKRLHDVHKRYVSQDYVKNRYGDLILQIDTDFKF